LSTEARFLILETSGRVGWVAVAQDAQLLAARRLDEARRHARDLPPTVADLLAGQGWKPREVQAVIVSRGPGSYTGLRVGLMSAKTFAYAMGCHLIALETFACIAVQAPPVAEVLDVLSDAQQGKVYWQRFTRAPGGADWIAATPLTIEDLSNWVSARPAEAWVTGPALHVYRSRLPGDLPLVDQADWDPKPENLLCLGFAAYQAGEFADFWRLEPLYLRPSAAEEKWLGRSQPPSP
jgi:tRNA threonylcarbamoyladenosine biosynthesis protein TsaB